MQSKNVAISTTQRSLHILSCICIAVAATVSTGCSTLPFSSAANGIVEDAPLDAGQYQLRMESAYGGSKTYKGSIDGPITIQTALERSGAIKKFRNMNIDLFRKVEGAYQPLKMSALYDAGEKMVRPETDYGLRAGDSILVSPKSEVSTLSKMMGTFSQ